MAGKPPTKAEVFRAMELAHKPLTFPTMTRITRMDGSIGPIPLTPHQQIMLHWFAAYAWTFLVKYRQAAASTIHVSDQLRHVQYTPGAMGLLVGDKEDTYKELIRRQGVMYENFPEFIRPPLARPVSSESIVFDKPHSGLIQGITGGGENPAIGFSPDYALISEYGLFAMYEQFNGAFFPAINRRPNAKCRIETTPGRYQTPAHQMWVNSLSGKGRFKSLFLAWWRDPTCVSHDPPMPFDFRRTSEEDKYAEKLLIFEKAALLANEYWYPYTEPYPIRDEQLWFRRIALETEFHGDPRLFDSKYPPTPYDGWLIGQSPTIPPEPVEKMLLTAHRSPEGVETFYHPDGTVAASLEELVAANPGMPMLITCDGKGYGRKGDGDPAAITLWSLWDMKEAGTWSGDEDPGEITPRILRWQKATNAHVAVETNKDGVAAALQQAQCPKLWWSGPQPGWYATEMSKASARVALVNMLRQTPEPWLYTWELLQQLLTWDGKTRSDETTRRKHHWDRATTALIFAAVAPQLGEPRRPRPVEPKSSVLSAEAFLAEWDRLDRQRASRWDDDRY
jgi:hypothetical protein